MMDARAMRDGMRCVRARERVDETRRDETETRVETETRRDETRREWTRVWMTDDSVVSNEAEPGGCGGGGRVARVRAAGWGDDAREI
jgi:hypothetical protein